MTGIIETLKKDWNIKDTNDANISIMPAGHGFELEINTDTKPEEWFFLNGERRISLEDTSVDVHAKSSADKFIAAYRKATLDVLDFDQVEEPHNGFKKGGYNKIKEEIEDVPEEVNVFSDEYDYSEIREIAYEEVGEQKKVPLPRPGRRIKNLKPELMEVGTIRAGEKYEKNGKVLPRATEYFRITTKAKNKLGYELDQEIHNVVGPEPKRLKVRLPCDREDLNFVSFYGKYKASKCECRGDGFSAETFEGDLIECNGERCEHYLKGECKKHGVLSVILEDAPRCGVIWKFRTTSNSSISYLDAAVSLLTGYASGHVAELPLWLTLSPLEKTIPSGPQRGTKKTYYIANLEYRGGYRDLKANVQKLLASRNGADPVKAMERLMEASLSLPETPDEMKDIQETFYPEA